MFQATVDKKKIGLRLGITTGGPNVDVDLKHGYSIVADESRIRQVLVNLIANGIKFTHKGGIDA